MRIGITGGSGFLGRHLAAALIADGHAVRVVDKNVRREPLPWGLGGVPATIVETDVADADALASALAGVEAIVHLAGMALPRRCREFPLEAFVANGLGTAAVIDAARLAGIARVVTASSRWVAEATLPSSDAYVMSKWVAEMWTLGAGQVVARLDNTYGPGQPEGTVVPDFIARARAGAAPYASPRGESVPLLYVSDTVRALALLAVTSGASGIYAVCAPAVVPLASLADALTAMRAGATVRATPGASREPDARLAALGWKAEVSWPEGVALTWEAR